MKSVRLVFAAALIACVVGAPAGAQPAPPLREKGDAKGAHDFDFLIGRWIVHHRVLKERLAGSHDWLEYDGTLSTVAFMNGRANAGDNLFRKPGGDVRGVSLRAYDPKTGEWSVWWLDGRNPSGNLDPPTRGRFENGIGTFLSDDTLRGKPVRLRVIWSRITPTSARWEQALSADGGKTWETNWISDFTRAP